MERTTYWASIKTSTQSIGGIIEIYEAIPYVSAGATIKSNKTGVTTTILLVLSEFSFQVQDSTGFTADTTVIITVATFTGESLASYIPEINSTGETKTFLNVIASELQSCYTEVNKIPEVRDVDKCPTQMLPHLATSYGVYFDPDLDALTRRELIRLSQYIYLKRGTKDGLVAIFNALGYEAAVQELYTKAYVNEIESISGDVITLKAAGAELPPAGLFSVRALMTKPTTIAWVRKINNALEFEVDAGVGASFSPSDTVNIYEYSTVKDIVNFPYTSSFINIVYADRNDPPRLLTDSILRILNNYLREFKSSHARLWGGTGIERILSNIISFREDGEPATRGILCINEVPVYTVDRDNLFTGLISAAALNEGSESRLDSNLQLDDVTWLSTETVTEFNREPLDMLESIGLSEDWEVVRRV